MVVKSYKIATQKVCRSKNTMGKAVQALNGLQHHKRKGEMKTRSRLMYPPAKVTDNILKKSNSKNSSCVTGRDKKVTAYECFKSYYCNMSHEQFREPVLTTS